MPRRSTSISRSTRRLALAASALGALALPAAAQPAATPAEQAAKLAEDGKNLSIEGQHAQASEKFRQAVVLSPEGKFYLYLCISLSKEGKLGEAINACDAVERNGADEKTLGKTRQMTESLRADMKKQGMDPDKALAEGRAQNPGQDPAGGGASPAGGGSSAVGVTPTAMPQYVGAPPAAVYGVQAVPHKYTWSLGIDLFGAGTSIGDPDVYNSGGGGFRVRADVLAIPSLKIGGQGYIGATFIPSSDSFYEDLNVIDFGIAGFKHLCARRLCLTPLVGMHIAGMQPDRETDDSVNMFTVGLRAEAAAALTLGSRYEHVIGASLGMNLYAPAVGDYDVDPETYGLDEPGASVYVGLGYTYRFDTPLGQSPFITFD